MSQSKEVQKINLVEDEAKTVAGRGREPWEFAKWLAEENAYSDILISSRVRLARNLKGFRFPNRGSAGELGEVRKKVKEACIASPTFKDADYIEVDRLQAVDCNYLVERRLASPQLVGSEVPSLLVVGAEEDLSLMVNEEDHLRIQCIEAGMGIRDAWKKISTADSELEQNLDFSYSTKFGYLTACPTNIGTGMRVSIFAHLPALALNNTINSVIKKLPVSEISVRGIYGEGSESVGSIFQISNQLTLGRTEENVIERMIATAKQLIDLERECRVLLFEKEKTKLEDKVFRALCILQNARIMSSMEAMTLLSTIRLGVELGLVKGISRLTINQFLVMIQPAHLQKVHKRSLDADQRDVARATFLRDNIKCKT